MYGRAKAQSNISKVNGREFNHYTTTDLKALLLGEFRYNRVRW